MEQMEFNKRNDLKMGYIMGAITGCLLAFLIKSMLDDYLEEKDKEIDQVQKKREEYEYAHPFYAEELMEEEEQVIPEEEEKTEPLNQEAKNIFPLKLGSSGEQVKRLQIFLMRKLGWVKKPDGEFDEITKKRVKQFFKTEEITEDIYQKYTLDKMLHDQRKTK